MGDELRTLWEASEAALTPDAVFAKSLDRVQPVMANLMSGGGTWVTYDVTLDQLDQRVGAKVARGAPGLWSWVRRRVSRWFVGRGGPVPARSPVPEATAPQPPSSPSRP